MEALILACDAFKRITEDRRLVPEPSFEKPGCERSHRIARATLASVAASLAGFAVIAVALTLLTGRCFCSAVEIAVSGNM